MNESETVIQLNVGGDVIQTYSKTLYESRYFRMLLNNMRRVREMTVDGSIFIDRSKDLFKYVLQYLRFKKLYIDGKDQDFLGELEDEADFYEIKGLKELIQRKYIHPKSLVISLYK
ncbi:unnamed protein product [Rhizopus stolonifer]